VGRFVVEAVRPDAAPPWMPGCSDALPLVTLYRSGMPCRSYGSRVAGDAKPLVEYQPSRAVRPSRVV
jgi:hypothetical protein